jgi:hypothetical protein
MPKKPINNPRDINEFPDWAIATDQQAARLMGFSTDTLDRLTREGKAPPVVWLSARRKGRTIGSIKKWIAERISGGSTTQGAA